MLACTQFNRKLMDFVDDMGTSHPTVREFDMLHKTSAMLAKLDPTQPMLMFERFVSRPYGDAIRSRDEAFMLAEDFVKEQQSGPDIVSIVKGVWRDMDANDKDAVWRHLQTLVTLSAVAPP